MFKEVPTVHFHYLAKEGHYHTAITIHWNRGNGWIICIKYDALEIIKDRMVWFNIPNLENHLEIWYHLWELYWSEIKDLFFGCQSVKYDMT